MRRFSQVLTAFGLLCGLSWVCQAADDEAAAIVNKAIKAHGLNAKDLKEFAYKGTNKGTLHIAGMDLEFNQEVAIQTPGKFKEVMDFTIMNIKVTVTTVFNGKEGWIKANDKDVPVKGDLLAELKEAAYWMQLSQAMFLKDKSLKLSLLGEVQVNGKPAVGIKVEKEGKKDIDFYFDKDTGLIAKTQRRARDFQSGQEVLEERIITEYQKYKGGRKIAKKVEVKRDGKKFLEAEVIEANIVDHVDDSEFAKPE